MKKIFSLSFVIAVFFLLSNVNLNAQNVPLDPSFNVGSGFNNSVNSISPQADGKLIVAGSFTSYNGSTANRMVRLNTNGTLDPSFSLDQSINASTPFNIRVLPSGKIITCGFYKNVSLKNGGIGAGELNVFNSDGSIYSGFFTNRGDGIPDAKNFDVDPNGKVIVVGLFRFMYDDSMVIDIPDGVMRLNADGSRDQFFQAGAGTGFENLITGGVTIAGAEALENGKYLLYGNFQRFSGRNAKYFVRLNSNGSQDTTFNLSGSGFNGRVSDVIELPDGKYLVAGIFTSYNGINVKKIARLFPNGTLDTTFRNTIEFNVIEDIVLKSDGKILVGYDVVFGGGGYSNGILQLNENGSYDNSLNFGSGIYPYGQFVNSICIQPDNNLIIAGSFTGVYNNTSSPRIARLLPCGSGRRDTVYACNSYIWNSLSYTTTGVYTQTINSTNGCSRVDTLQLFVSAGIPASPTITQTLVSNVCGVRVYRYSANIVTNSIGYTWTLPSSVGGVAGVILDSGNSQISRIIKVRYTSNEAAVGGDSIKVRAFSGCGQSSIRSAKLINAKLNVPTAPASITITPLQTNVCGARIYRYAAPTLPAATTTATAATGYSWDFIGTLRLSGLIIDSGSLTSQKLVVRFSSNNSAITGDSVRVCYTSACGNSIRKSSKLTNTFIGVPLAPSSIIIQSVEQNVCNARLYRYVAPNLPAATTTACAATGWNWEIIGALAQYASIDSGDVNAQKIIFTFSSNSAAVAGDSIKLFYASGCGESKAKLSKLSNTALRAPAAPTSITIQPIQTNICNARKYRYIAPNLPVATTTTGAAKGYQWSFVGVLSSTLTIDSGSLTSQKLTVTFTSNDAALVGDSVRLLYSSDCGNSLRKSSKLSNTLLSAPLAPSSIAIQTVSDVCGARKYRYIAPAILPIATTTVGAASGYLWSTPTGIVGSTGTIDSGTVNSQKITVTYTSNAAASTDSIRLRYTSDCGNGAIKAQKLSNLSKTCFASGSSSNEFLRNNTEIKTSIYPNPNHGKFNLFIQTGQMKKSLATIQVIDMLGKVVNVRVVENNNGVINTNLNLNLNEGIYYVKYILANVSNSVRMVVIN